MPHAGDWQQGGVYRETERFTVPLETAQAGRGGGDLPKQLSFLEVGPTEIELSAIKKCDSRDSIILRLFNPTLEELTGQIKSHRAIQEAWITNMNEERREQLKPSGSSVDVPFGHKQIVTIELLLAEK